MKYIGTKRFCFLYPMSLITEDIRIDFHNWNQERCHSYPIVSHMLVPYVRSSMQLLNVIEEDFKSDYDRPGILASFSIERCSRLSYIQLIVVNCMKCSC